MIPKNIISYCARLFFAASLMLFNATHGMKKVPTCPDLTRSDIEMNVLGSPRLDADFDATFNDPIANIKTPLLAQIDEKLEMYYAGNEILQPFIAQLVATDDILAHDTICNTRLHYAVDMWDYEVIANLISFDATKLICNTQNTVGETGLHILLKREPRTTAEAEKILHLIGFAQLHGADFSIRNHEGESLLHHAVHYQTYNDECTKVRARLVEALVTRGIDVNSPTLFTGQTPLHYACKTNYAGTTKTERGLDVAAPFRLGMIPTLLALGADPSAADSGGDTPLHMLTSNKAVQDSKKLIESVVLLLENPNKSQKNANANDRNAFGFTPLHCLMHLKPTESSLRAGKELLAAQADSNILTRDGFAPLHIAVYNKHLEWVKLLTQWPRTNCCIVRNAQKGTVLQALTSDVLTPLDMANDLIFDVSSCNSGDSSSEDETDSQIERRLDELEHTILTGQGQTDEERSFNQLIDLLEEKSIEYIDKALATQTLFGQTKQLRQLACNKSITAQDDEGNTRLHHAIRLLDPLTVHILLSIIADQEQTCIKNKRGETPLLYMMRCHEHGPYNGPLIKKIMKALFENDALPDEANNDGETALHYLVRYENKDAKYPEGCIEVAQTLIDQGATLDAHNKQGETALHYVFKYNNHANHNGQSILSILLANQANPNALMDEHKLPITESPITYAVTYGCGVDHFTKRKEALELLVQSGALVDGHTGNKETPLHTIFKTFATREHNPVPVLHRLPFVKPLIDLGANPNAQDPLGNTPLHSLMTMKCTDALHTIAYILLKRYQVNPNMRNKAGFTPLHLAVCSQQPRWVKLLLENGANVHQLTKPDNVLKNAGNYKSALDLALELLEYKVHTTCHSGTFDLLWQRGALDTSNLFAIVQLFKDHTSDAICKQLLFLVRLSSSSVTL